MHLEPGCEIRWQWNVASWNIPRHKKNQWSFLFLMRKSKNNLSILWGNSPMSCWFSHWKMVNFPPTAESPRKITTGEFEKWIPRCLFEIPMVCGPKDLETNQVLCNSSKFYHVLFLIKSWILACPRWTGKEESENCPLANSFSSVNRIIFPIEMAPFFWMKYPCSDRPIKWS